MLRLKSPQERNTLSKEFQNNITNREKPIFLSIVVFRREDFSSPYISQITLGSNQDDSFPPIINHHSQLHVSQLTRATIITLLSLCIYVYTSLCEKERNYALLSFSCSVMLHRKRQKYESASW